LVVGSLSGRFLRTALLDPDFSRTLSIACPVFSLIWKPLKSDSSQLSTVRLYVVVVLGVTNRKS
jgi:hypothetical protein